MRAFNSSRMPLPKSLCFAPLDQKQKYALEIGAGVGLHAIQFSQTYPEVKLFAIERTKERFEKLKRRRQAHGAPENLFLVNDEAQTWVTHCLQDELLETIFILYPNPNPKNASQRWVRMPFMQKLIDCLRPNGEIVLATNQEWYFQEACQYFQETWNLHLIEASVISRDAPHRSHFEKKYLKRGEKCFNIITRKSDFC